MKKLKLHMFTTADGFVADPQGRQDWLTGWWDNTRNQRDEQLWRFENQFADSTDTILLGRKLAGDFIGYWESVPLDHPEYPFARKLVDTPKVIFSNTITSHPGQHVRVEQGSLVKAVHQLKGQTGKDIVVYGGATLVASLLAHDLIDEFVFIINPVAIGAGIRIFSDHTPLRLESSTAFANGVVVSVYSRSTTG